MKTQLPRRLEPVERSTSAVSRVKTTLLQDQFNFLGQPAMSRLLEAAVGRQDSPDKPEKEAMAVLQAPVATAARAITAEPEALAA